MNNTHITHNTQNNDRRKSVGPRIATYIHLKRSFCKTPFLGESDGAHNMYIMPNTQNTHNTQSNYDRRKGVRTSQREQHAWHVKNVKHPAQSLLEEKGVAHNAYNMHTTYITHNS